MIAKVLKILKGYTYNTHNTRGASLAVVDIAYTVAIQHNSVVKLSLQYNPIQAIILG